MMAYTLSDRVLQSRRIPNLAPLGSHFAVRPDLYLLPEYSLALIAGDLKKFGAIRVNPDKILIVSDHFSPPSSIERANILAEAEAIVDHFGWSGSYQRFQGISHQVLLEDERLSSGCVVIGADSHTVTAGAVGAYAAGFGAHDLFYALANDAIWLAKTPGIAVVIVGEKLPPGISGKDICLEMFRQLGPLGLHQKSIEFFDETKARLDFADRVPLCNMVVDGGAANGLFAQEAWNFEPSRASAYETVLEIDCARLEPLVAAPHSPFSVQSAALARGVRITQAYLGSCNGGRLLDFKIAAEIVRGQKVAKGVKAIAIPSSQQEYLLALRAGYLEILVEAGFVIGNPSCGPCGGIDKGILGDADVCIATMNRNFQGRMGSPSSQIWLASSATVAASALFGRIATADEVFVC